MENNRLTGQVLVIVLGEGDVDILLLAGGHAYNLLLKAGNKRAGAQLQVEVLALAAFKSHAVVEALEVDVGGIAHLSRTLHSLGGSHILSHLVQLSLHLGVGHLSLSLLHFHALVLTQSNLGINIGGQGDGNHIVLADLHIGQVGTAHSLHILLHNSFFVNLGEDLLQTIFKEHMRTIHGLNHLPGSLALTEAGNQNALASLQVSLVYTGLHQVLVNLDHDGSLVAVLLDAFNVHVLCPPKIRL